MNIWLVNERRFGLNARMKENVLLLLLITVKRG